MKTYEDLNYASDADPDMWLDRREATCLIPKPVVTKFNGDPVKTTRVELTPTMRKVMITLRKQADLTQEAVGLAMGRTQGWVSLFETGSIQSMDEVAFNDLWDLYHARIEGEAAG